MSNVAGKAGSVGPSKLYISVSDTSDLKALKTFLIENSTIIFSQLGSRYKFPASKTAILIQDGYYSFRHTISEAPHVRECSHSYTILISYTLFLPVS